MIRLAEINAAAEIAKYETGCQTQPTNIEARLDELTAAFKSTTLEIKDEFSQKFSSVDQKMNLVLSTISQLSLEQRSPAQKLASTSKESVHPVSQEEDAPDEDELDRVFCSKCQKLSYACQCVFTSLETAYCIDEECGFEDTHVRLRLDDIEKILRNAAEIPGPCSANFNCPLCEKTTVMLRINEIQTEHRPCEQCLGIDGQDSIQQCEAKDCIPGVFYHASCMVKCGTGDLEDEYICKTCHAEGKTAYIDDGTSDDSGESWTDQDEFEHRAVDKHLDLYIGKPMRGGKVQEIYPGLDKFTVERNSAGISHIEHLTISEHGKRTSSTHSTSKASVSSSSKDNVADSGTDYM